MYAHVASFKDTKPGAIFDSHSGAHPERGTIGKSLKPLARQTATANCPRGAPFTKLEPPNLAVHISEKTREEIQLHRCPVDRALNSLQL